MYKADRDEVRNLPEKEKSFRACFPEHAEKKLYLALASMSSKRCVKCDGQRACERTASSRTERGMIAYFTNACRRLFR